MDSTKEKVYQQIFGGRRNISEEAIRDMSSLIEELAEELGEQDVIDIISRAISIYNDADKIWTVYILRCSDNSLYCGMASDLAWRLADHRTGRGSKYVRSRLPFKLVWSRYVREGKSAALKLEAKIKKMSKAAKEKLITKNK